MSEIKLPPLSMALNSILTAPHAEAYARIAIELDRQGRGKPVVWTMAPQQVIMLAEELIVGALAMGGADDDGVESDVRLMIRMPGTVADDDGKFNERPIFAFCSDEYPEEGVYPIDPVDCKPAHEHAPQPADPVVKESLTVAEPVEVPSNAVSFDAKALAIPGGMLAFDDGSLLVRADGSGYIAVPEDQFTLHDDRCEGPDGPQGSVCWIAELPTSEIVALRDFLNGQSAQPTSGEDA